MNTWKEPIRHAVTMKCEETEEKSHANTHPHLHFLQRVVFSVFQLLFVVVNTPKNMYFCHFKKGQILAFVVFEGGGQLGDVAEQSNRWW